MKLHKIFLESKLHQNTISVSKGTLLSEALNVMSEKQISCLLVTEDEKPIGILTERDIVKIASKNAKIGAIIISDVMSSPVISISIHTNILEAYGVLRTANIRHLALIDENGNARGVVTQTDIIRELGERLGQNQKVFDIMTKNVFAAKTDDIMLDTIKLMADRSISCVVVEENFKPIGLITERDVSNLLAKGIDLSKETLGKWMSSPVEFIDSATSIVEAVRQMEEKKHRRFLVMNENGRLTGLITQTDIVRGLLEGDYVRSLREQIAEKDVALQKNEERYRVLVEGVRIIGWEYDYAEERFTFVSGRAEEISGYKSELWYEKGFWADHIHPEDRSNSINQLAHIVEKIRNHAFEYRMITPDGGFIWLRNIVEPTIGDGGEVLLRGILFDITEEKKLQEQVIRASKLSSIGTFVAGVAHELNNPLTSVILYSESLVEDSKELPEDVIKGLETIRKQSERAGHIVQNLLKFSRGFEPGKLLCHINEILESTVQLHEYHIRADNIDIVKKLGLNIPEFCVDSNQLQQVFSNIIINAQQAMNEANIKGEIRVISRSDEDAVTAIIENDGPTIPEKELEKIFDPFFTTKDVGMGTGLGLSIAYGIVEEHGGTMHIENIDGSGVRVIMTFPIDDAERNAPFIEDVDDFPNLEIANSRILLIDDEENIRNLISLTLFKHDVTVLSASNGKEAIGLLSRMNFDVILSDYKMPDMNGLELGNWIYNNRPEYLKRFVLVTGSIDATINNYCVQFGCRQVSKPFKMAELLETIREVIKANLEN